MPNDYMQNIYGRAQATLNSYCIEKYGRLDSPDNDPETLITDLMADLMHLAVLKELDLGRIQRLAEMHFSAEQLEEAGEEAGGRVA